MRRKDDVRDGAEARRSGDAVDDVGVPDGYYGARQMVTAETLSHQHAGVSTRVYKKRGKALGNKIKKSSKLRHKGGSPSTVGVVSEMGVRMYVCVCALPICARAWRWKFGQPILKSLARPAPFWIVGAAVQQCRRCISTTTQYLLYLPLQRISGLARGGGEKGEERGGGGRWLAGCGTSRADEKDKCVLDCLDWAQADRVYGRPSRHASTSRSRSVLPWNQAVSWWLLGGGMGCSGRGLPHAPPGGACGHMDVASDGCRVWCSVVCV